MDISIVIVNYNTSKLLDECISSIKKETRCLYEIIVVDNASQDDSVSILTKKHPDVMLIQNQKNNGFAFANNQGFKVSKGRYFMMLNPDTLILETAIDILVGFMDTHPDTGICSPRNEDSAGNLQFNCDFFPSIIHDLFEYLNLGRRFPGIKMFNKSQMQYWSYDEIKDVDKVMGCSLLIQSDLYFRVGGLDNHYFMYFEETDLCFQVKKNKYKIMFIPSACIIHYGGESSKSQSENKVVDKTISKYFFESKSYFYKKNYGLIRAFISRVVDILFAFGVVLRNAFRKDKMLKAKRLEKGKAYLACFFPKRLRDYH